MADSAEWGRRLLLGSGLADGEANVAHQSLGMDRRFRGLKPRDRELRAAPSDGGLANRELYQLKKADKKAQQMMRANRKNKKAGEGASKDKSRHGSGRIQVV